MNKGCKTHNRVWKNLAWAEEEGRREYLQPGRPLSNYSMVSFDIKVTPNFEGLGALLPFQDLIKFGEGFSSKASNLSYWKKKKRKKCEVSIYFSWAWSGTWRCCLCQRCCQCPPLALRFSVQTGTLSSHRDRSSTIWLSSHSQLLQGLLMGNLSFITVTSILGDGTCPCSHLCFYTCCAAKNNC